MATVACPGCGLPRVESEVGAKPCPVCDAAPLTGTGGLRPPLARKTAEPDPTEGLPADASELYGPNAPPPARPARPAPERPREPAGFGGPCGSRAAPLGAAMFLLGAVCGVGGTLGWQTIDWFAIKRGGAQAVARAEDTQNAPPGENPPAPTAPQVPAIAPMPHEPKARSAETQPPETEPEPEPKQAPPPPGRVTIVEINEPTATYSVPFPMKKGEHVVLKGKVKWLKVHVLDGGATLDASALEAETVTVGSKIDNRSTLKVNAPKGTVTVSGKVDGGSRVEVNAPGGGVNFSVTTTEKRDGSKIGGGSVVAITARYVEFKGDIAGTDTRVSVVFTRNGFLRFASLSGKSILEYRSQVADWSPPDVVAGTVAPTATFRKTE